MKKFLYLAICIMFFTSFLSLSPLKNRTVAYAASEEPIITFLTEKQSDAVIEVQAKISNNKGILAMSLDLIYDNTAMTLTNVVYGDALNSLSPISTNPNTEQGFGIYPFKFSYEGEANDYSEGVLMAMTFRINSECKNGKYNITFGYEKDKSVTFISGNIIKTKNLIIDRISVTVSENNAVNVSVVKENTKKNNDNLLFLIISIVVCCVMVVSIVIVLVLKRKHKKPDEWVKL